jgi:hypothetical protein
MLEGDSYRGRENSYTQGSTMELNGVDFGLGPAARWARIVRARAFASSVFPVWSLTVLSLIRELNGALDLCASQR